MNTPQNTSHTSSPLDAQECISWISDTINHNNDPLLPEEHRGDARMGITRESMERILGTDIFTIPAEEVVQKCYRDLINLTHGGGYSAGRSIRYNALLYIQNMLEKGNTKEAQLAAALLFALHLSYKFRQGWSDREFAYFCRGEEIIVTALFAFTLGARKLPNIYTFSSEDFRNIADIIRVGSSAWEKDSAGVLSVYVRDRTRTSIEIILSQTQGNNPAQGCLLQREKFTLM